MHIGMEVQFKRAGTQGWTQFSYSSKKLVEWRELWTVNSVPSQPWSVVMAVAAECRFCFEHSFLHKHNHWFHLSFRSGMMLLMLGGLKPWLKLKVLSNPKVRLVFACQRNKGFVSIEATLRQVRGRLYQGGLKMDFGGTPGSKYDFTRNASSFFYS